MKRLILILISLLACLALSGCGNSAKETTPATEAPSATEAATAAPAEATEAAGDTEWKIALADLGTEPSFPEWNQNGTKMQLIALLDESGNPHIAYNTCQVCAGSPYAYFEYENGLLKCMNCGNMFALSTVGEASGGCTPLPLDAYTVSDREIIIPQSELERAVSAFANWKKGL